MVLDEPRETDETFNVNGFTMVIDKDLLGHTKDVTVDYVVYGIGSGFQITSEVPVTGGASGGSCSSSCSC